MSFDLKAALQCAAMAKHAYTFAEADLVKLGEPVFIPVQDQVGSATSFGAVYVLPDRVIVAYRGTMTNVPDWIKNLQLRLVPSDLGGKVHHGFSDELRTIQPQIDEAVSLHRGDRQLYVTGHSQGGAVAALATRHFEKLGIPVTATYTFAAPRPGDIQFRDSFITPVHRIEYGNDIVVHVPFADAVGRLLSSGAMWLAMQWANPMIKKLAKLAKESAGYVSVGRLTYIPVAGKWRTELSSGEELGLVPERVWGLLRTGGQLVEHHAMDNYSKQLQTELDAVARRSQPTS